MNDPHWFQRLLVCFKKADIVVPNDLLTSCNECGSVGICIFFAIESSQFRSSQSRSILSHHVHRRLFDTFFHNHQ